MRIIRQSAFKSVPWKNGGGVTHEALRVPESGDSFSFRVSVARIDASGAFSDFAGYRRTMVLLRGDGLVLRFANGDARELARAGDAVQFDGAVPVVCELSSGPCTDLNLMVSSALPAEHAAARRFEGPLSLPADVKGTTLIFPIDAPLEVHAGNDAAKLEPWDLAVFEHEAGAPSRILSAAAGALAFVATLPIA
jgi:environmental stress-induced protein Ves